MRQPSRLTVGNKLRCPHCEQLGDPLYAFRPLELKEKYSEELNVVQCHRKDRGGCGHVFSLGEPNIIAAYIAGDLVPRQLLEDALRKVRELQAVLSEGSSSNGSIAREEVKHA